MQVCTYKVARGVLLDAAIIWVLKAKVALTGSVEQKKEVIEMKWQELVSIPMRGSRGEFAAYVARLKTKPDELLKLLEMANQRVIEPYTEDSFMDTLEFCMCAPYLARDLLRQGCLWP